MRNVYYKYNDKTKTYDRVYPSHRARILTYLRNGFFFILLGVGGYFAAVLLLGMPESAEDLRSESGEKIPSAPHPYMLFKMKVPFDVKVGDILRSGEK